MLSLQENLNPKINHKYEPAPCLIDKENQAIHFHGKKLNSLPWSGYLWPDVMFQVVSTSPLQHQLSLNMHRLSVCSRTAMTTPWWLTCGGLWDDGGPSQSGSGEQDVVTLLPQFEDPTQKNWFTDTQTHTDNFSQLEISKAKL